MRLVTQDTPAESPAPRGRPLRLDPTAVSAQPGAPAFVAPPAGAPAYYGFPVLEDVEVEGFRFGMITDWETEPDVCGDAFVVAPDDSRAGLVWEVHDPPYFEEVCRPDPGRWGVWAVTFPLPMSSRENARRNLAAILPPLRERWQAWRQAH